MAQHGDVTTVPQPQCHNYSTAITMLQKRRVLFAGHVQGVGFRYTTAQLAKGYDVVGTVRNLEDRRVELIVEGERTEINQLLTALRNHFDGSIREEISETLPASGQMTNFDIVD